MATRTKNPERIIKSIYMDPKVWKAAKAKADAEGTNISRILRNCLKAYVEGVPTPENPSEEIFD